MQKDRGIMDRWNNAIKEGWKKDRNNGGKEKWNYGRMK